MSDKVIRNFAIIFFATLFIYLAYIKYIGIAQELTYNPYSGEKPRVENTLTTFEVTYKDGTKNKVNAASVIYGQTNDNIYFLGNNKDTLYIMPKINVEEVKTLSK